MFSTFLNKPDHRYLDISVFINCNPDRILFYYYNSDIKITLDTYLQMKEWAQTDGSNRSCLNQWIDLFEYEVDMSHDLIALQKSEYLISIGPYYYVPTNTRFYVTKLNIIDNEPLTSVDFGTLFNLHKTPPIDKDLEKYFRLRKNPKKTPRNKDDLIRDISMCLEALNQIEKLAHHSEYFNIFLDRRNAIIERDDVLPLKPDHAPEKPERPEEIPLFVNGMLNLTNIRSRQKNYQQSCSDYNRNMKIYYIRYREFEKACERYKDALLDWEQFHEGFLEICLDDIEDADTKLSHVRNLIETYSFILMRSFVHSDYHSVNILSKFKAYLESGRAEDLQDCMNLYEEEIHWIEIKASQERIENTIHFLQSEIDLSNLTLEQASELIASASERRR